jgi:hypothetical protein
MPKSILRLLGVNELVRERTSEVLKQLQPLLSHSEKAVVWGQVFLCSGAFCQLAFGAAAIVNVVQGALAQKRLEDFYTQIGHDVSAIRESLQSLNENVAALKDSVAVLVNNAAQRDFGHHVHDFVKMRQKQLSMEPGMHFLFVYHPGNEWHGRLHSLLEESPIPQLCGLFDDLDTLGSLLLAYRKFVGPEPKFHILMPATEIYYIDEDLSWPDEALPMVFEGEKSNHSRRPYVHFRMPGVAPEMLSGVVNVSNEPIIAPEPTKSSIWKRVASTSAAWGAGLPAAMVATPGGMIVGAAGCVILAPLAAPGAVVLGVIGGCGVVAGASAGTVTGLFVGAKVEEAWDE